MHELVFPGAPVKPVQPGFTLIELLLTMVVFGLLLAIGVPNMSKWVLANKVRSASEFYVDGFAMARRQALTHNSFSRIVLTPNVNTGQMDWQVDICFNSPTALCTDVSGSWSTTAAPAGADPQGAAGYLSVYRSADALPSSELLQPAALPAGASQVYYMPVGWVNTNIANRLSRLTLTPAAQFAGDVPTVALVVTLAGMAAKCDPTVATGDSRGCPP